MMSERLEAIKKLQTELFVEEYGITKEQARRLNEYLFHEPTGEHIDGYLGRAVLNPSVDRMITELRGKNKVQNEKLSKLEWEHKKLWMSSWVFGMAVTAYIITSFFL